MRAYGGFLFLAICLSVSLGKDNFDRTLHGFKVLGQALGYKVELSHKRPSRDITSTASCVSYCSQDFTSCNMVNHPLFPIGLNLSVTEPIAAYAIAQLAGAPQLCQTALTLLTCSRLYPSCSVNGTTNTLNYVRPCKSVCLNVLSACSFLPPSDELNCTGEDYGMPRYVEDGTGECFTLEPFGPTTRAACAGGSPIIEPDDIMPFTSLPRAEVAALADIWFNNGPAWTVKSGWGVGDPCGGWYGVNCTTLPGNITTVAEIALGNNNLIGSIPDSLATGLTHLTSLDLSFNLLSGTLPSNIGYLDSLVYFSVAENILSGPIPASFQNLKNIVHLNLGSNENPPDLGSRLNFKPIRVNTLSGQLTNELMAQWTQIKYLNLANNKLSGAVPYQLGQLTTLLSVDLSYNLFTGLNFTFTNLINLNDFDIGNNLLRGSLPESIIACQQLVYFSVARNGFTGSIPPSYIQLTNIKGFSVMYNGLTGSLDTIFNMTSITQLATSYNTFSGSQLSSVCNLRNLQVWSAYGNKFPGTIPPCIFRDLPLFMIDFSYFDLHGTIPNEIGLAKNLILFSLLANNMTGTFPAAIGNMSSLMSVYLNDMPFMTGGIPNEWSALTNLQFLNMLNAGLQGTIPPALCAMTKLEQLFLQGNSLHGTLPDCITQLKSLKNFDFSMNNISGSIPTHMGAIDGLISLRAHRNSLSGTIPSSFSSLTNLQSLDLSDNEISQAFGDVATALTGAVSLTTLNLADNDIYGNIDYLQFLDGRTGFPYWLGLIDFNVAGNRIEGAVSGIFSIFSSLTSIDISNNGFMGQVDNIAPSTKVFIANGNPLLRADDGNIPTYLKTTSVAVKGPNENFSCPTFTGVTTTIYVQLDASYYNYTQCKCDTGFYGFRNTCFPCLDHGICDSDSLHTMMIVSPGYFPSPDPSLPPQMLIPCPQDTFETNPCNPNARYPFECLEGHTGRLCSQCLPGYRRDGFSCHECNEATKVVTLFFAIVAIILLYVYLLWPRLQVAESGLLKNFLFYTQAVGFVLTSASKWASPIPLVKQIYSGSNFNIGFLGFDCFASFTSRDEYLVTMLLPLIFLVATAAVYFTIVLVLMQLKPDSYQSDCLTWRYRCYYAFFFVINALYFPLTSRIFTAFSCTEDPVTNKSYLNSHPYIECTGSDPEYTGILSLAIVFLIPYVIGIPALFLLLLGYSRKSKSELHYNSSYLSGVTTFFIKCYREELYYWEFVIFGRKLIFSLFISLIPMNSPFLSLSIFIVVLVSILLNSWVVPYVMRSTNVLDLLGFAVILLTFLSGILFASPQYSSYSEPLAVVVFVLNAAIVAAYVVCYAAVIIQTRFPHLRKNSRMAAIMMSLIEFDGHANLIKVRNQSQDSLSSSGGVMLSPTTSSVDVSLSEYSPPESPNM